MTWLSTALKKEEAVWETGKLMLSEDGMYITHLALDILPVRTNWRELEQASFFHLIYLLLHCLSL